MATEWSEIRIGDLGRVITGRTPPGNDPSYYDGEVLFLTPSDMGDLRRINSTARTLSAYGARQLGRCLVPEGVGVSCIGWQMGKSVLINRPTITNQQINSIVVDRNIADPVFVYYSLLDRRDELFNLGAGGSRTPILNKGDFERLPFTLPPIRDQQAIAHILSSLDDRIELNRRMNETLEAMARVLFKSWFVDFDPVRAKAEGRELGLPKPIADLFPDSFEDSELGEIPRGWGVGPLGRFFEVGLGGAWGEDVASDRATLSVHCLRGIDCHELAEGRVPDVPMRWLSPKQVADRQLSDGTVLVEGSGSFCGRSMIWNGAYARLMPEPVSYSNFCKRLDPVCSPSQAVICWMQIRQAYRDGFLQSFRTGTAFPNFDLNGALGNLIVAVPPDHLADAYGRLFKPSQRIDLMLQSRTLAALRDALLRKLLSGDLRVKDAARAIERLG
jgi:type I restriction enzyme, S subunit